MLFCLFHTMIIVFKIPTGPRKRILSLIGDSTFNNRGRSNIETDCMLIYPIILERDARFTRKIKMENFLYFCNNWSCAYKQEKKRKEEKSDTKALKKACSDISSYKIYLEARRIENLIYIEDNWGLARLCVAGARAQDLVTLRYVGHKSFAVIKYWRGTGSGQFPYGAYEQRIGGDSQ